MGTITTGVWNGTSVPLANGGTNAALTASNGGMVYSTASALAILAGTAIANRVLLSGSSTTPSWSTATYPATTTVNQLLYSSSANVIGGLTTANNSVLLTNGSGVPAWQTLTSNAVTSIAGTVNQITVSAATGAVTLSMPASVIITTSVTAGNLSLTGNTLQSNNANGNINIAPNGTGKVGIGLTTPSYLCDVFGTSRHQKLIGNANTPSVSLSSIAVIGTGATFSISGSELAGMFTLNTGTGTLGSGVAAIFTLTSAMPSATFSSSIFSCQCPNIYCYLHYSYVFYYFYIKCQSSINCFNNLQMELSNHRILKKILS